MLYKDDSKASRKINKYGFRTNLLEILAPSDERLLFVQPERPPHRANMLKYPVRINRNPSLTIHTTHFDSFSLQRKVNHDSCNESKKRRVRFSYKEANIDLGKLNDYKIQKQIGKGSMATVLLVELGEEKRVAKVVSKKKDKNACDNEINSLKMFQHINIIRLFQIIQDLASNRMYLILEHCDNGHLLSKEHRDSLLNDFLPGHDLILLKQKVAKFYFKSIAQAICHIHSAGYCHLDIKPDNILLKGSIPKLADFGLSRRSVRQQTQFNGTPYFLAPERFTDNSYDPRSSDIWALGITIYKCLSGRYPFKGSKFNQLKQDILLREVEYPQWVSQQAKQLLQKMLNKQSLIRATIYQVLRSKWLQKQ